MPSLRASQAASPILAKGGGLFWRQLKKALRRRLPNAAALSDALVLFGATGDLAYKQIFPSLQQMIRHGNLNVPVIGVAKAGWSLDQLREHARESLEKHGGVDKAAFSKLLALLNY